MKLCESIFFIFLFPASHVQCELFDGSIHRVTRWTDPRILRACDEEREDVGETVHDENAGFLWLPQARSFLPVILQVVISSSSFLPHIVAFLRWRHEMGTMRREHAWRRLAGFSKVHICMTSIP